MTRAETNGKPPNGSAENAPAPPAGDPVESAMEVGLVYVCDEEIPGIRRVRKGRGFTYLRPDGSRVGDAKEVARIRSLAIPPAWKQVWICAITRGHLQATGRDARGRKQYRYHPRWREVRDANKFHRVTAFGRHLPRIRRRVERDLRRRGLSRERVLAAVVKLLETSLIRVGNSEYARANKSFGLTTLRDKHVVVKGSLVHFEFRGKSGVRQAVDISDRRLARIIRSCQELPGQELFQYVDEGGQRHSVSSSDVNDYVRGITGHEFTSKDFRTWAATVLAARALLAMRPFTTQAQARRRAGRAIESVARRLGNTKAVCRNSYVHPAVVEAFLDPSLTDAFDPPGPNGKAPPRELAREELSVLVFLERRLRKKRRRRRRE